ncbi:MAG: response regulator [Methylococcales bacterium]
MNQFNYRRKFAFLGIISLIAIGILIYSLFLGLNQVVTNSQQQLQGLRLLTPLSKIIQNVQQHRGLSAGFLGGNKSMSSRREKIERKVSSNLNDMESYAPLLLTNNANWVLIKKKWREIINTGLKQSIASNFTQHTQLIEQLEFLKIMLADEYALTFTTEMDTFYLLDTSIKKLPNAMELLAQMRDFGTSILAKKHATEYQRIELIVLIAKLEVSLRQLTINLNKTASLNNIISSQLHTASTDITDSAHQIIALVQADILGKVFHTKPTVFFTQVTKAIDNIYSQLYQTLLPTTKAITSKRLQQAKNILYISIGISLLLLLIVLYFVIGIYYSMRGSIQILTRSLHAFADGDLHQRIHLNTQDELNHIGNSFNQLAEKTTYLLANLENSQKKTQQVLDSLLTMVNITLPDGTLDFASSRPLELAGLTQEDVLGKKIWDCPWFTYSKSTQQLIKGDCQLAAKGEYLEREVQFLLADQKIWVDFSVHPVFDNEGKVNFLVAEARDATRRHIAEEHSKRSQKMDALGKLVGGIAHDYNNMLGVILGYAELLEMKYEDWEDENYIAEIMRAGERGRVLTRKMLAFSKSESGNPIACNINQILVDLKDMLSKSLTASIKLNYDLYENVWPVWLDVHELEDAILNMSINAKYAMPKGGSLTITTQNNYISRDEAKLLGLDANDYVKLCVTDTGCGMDDETKVHVFDPFFTTKGEAGNGLGLSQVFAFTERSDGVINLYTQLGEGSQFSLYFPRYNKTHKTNKSFDSHSAPQLTGDERILVVDDEPALCELAKQILTHFSYHVFTASSGEAALKVLASQTIDLMLSDIIMPNMDGYQLSRLVAKQYPNVKIQLASGFSDNRHTESDKHLRQNMLQKPYSSKELLTSIRLLLDGFLLAK